MSNARKIELINEVLRNEPLNESIYINLLFELGADGIKYWEYTTTEPIDCDEELKQLPIADYNHCLALLTMLVREDHFKNGAIMHRYEKGQVNAILERMAELLQN